MVITLEFLNAIEGRPFPIGEWKQYVNPITGELGHFYTQEDEVDNWQGNRMSVSHSVELSMSDVPASMALEIATYAHRVETEVRRARNPCLTPIKRGDFNLGDLPPDDVERVWARRNIGTCHLWRKGRRSWREIFEDPYLDLDGTWRLEIAE